MDLSLSNTPAGTYTPVVIYRDIATTDTLNWSNLGTGRVDEYRVTLQASIAITLTGARDGQYCVLSVRQDGTGSRVITWGTEVTFTSIGGTPTLSTTASAEDILFFIYDKDLNKYRCVGFVVSSGTSTTLLNLYASGNTTLSSSGVNQPGALTFSGSNGISVGITGSKIVFYGSTGGLGTTTTLGQTAIGNTAGTTSSQTRAITAETFSGAGIISVGFNAGTVVFSATQSIQTLGIYAVGNTAGTTSSATFDARTISIRGSNLVSVGMSNGSLIFDATQSVQTLGMSAVGNTTGTTSSQTVDARSITFTAGGIASVGFNNSSIVISASSATSMGQTAIGNTIGLTSSQTRALTAETISGAGNVSVGFSNNTLVVSGAGGTLQYFEPSILPGAGTLTVVPVLGTMYVGIVNPPLPVTYNRIGFMGTAGITNPNMVVASTTGTESFTGSCEYGATFNLVHYSRVDATTFTSLSSQTAFARYAFSFSITQRSTSSRAYTVTGSYEFGAGTDTSQSTATLSVAVAIANAWSITFAPFGANISNFTANVGFVFPGNNSLSSGIQLAGLMLGSTGRTTATGNTNLTVTGPTWANAIAFFSTWGNSSVHRTQPLLAAFVYGIGQTSSAGSAIPGNVIATGLSSVGVISGAFPHIRYGLF